MTPQIGVNGIDFSLREVLLRKRIHTYSLTKLNASFVKKRNEVKLDASASSHGYH